MMATYEMDDLYYTDILDDDYITPDTINANLYDVYAYLQALYDSTHYKAGDTISYGRFSTVGFVTNSKQYLRFSIPLAHPCAASNVTVTGLFNVRQDNGESNAQNRYLVGSSSTWQSMNVDAYLNGGKDCVNCTATTTGNNSDIANGSVAVKNNHPAGIDITSLTIRFS